ncbi:MAG TPA: FG-GAP-like repeat-containing protein, partial [Pyrinomonadaceae bacterium]|nr:FG-GAP-like repeat-containing protein [Pyrinomonadaceae bacterium]
NDDIQIRSSVGGTQRTWSGSGTFSMIDVDVQDQKVPTLPPPAVILVNSGTPSGNTSGWTFIDQCTSGTYTWIGGTAGGATDWTIGTNWNPTRVTPQTGDVLIFDGTSTPSPTVTNVPTQTIAALRLTNNVFGVTLNASGANTLTISGNTGTDLDIPAGTLLTLAGSNSLTISLTGAGHQSTIAGQLVFQDGAHRLLGSNAGEITLTGVNAFTTATGFSGNPFGAGTNGSVIFQSGSTGAFNAGGDPFGGIGHSVATFNLGSTASFAATSAFSSDGRTYGNLKLTGTTSYAGSGANQTTVLNSFTLDANATFTLSGSAGGDLSVNGNFVDNNSSAGAFNANTRTVKFNGGSATQTITKAGGAESFFDVFIAEIAGGKVQLLSPVTINGQLNLSTPNSLLELNGQTLTLTGTISGSGNLKGDSSATLNVTGTGALGTMNFVSTGRTLASLTMNRTSSGAATVGNDLSAGSLTLTDGYVDMGSNTLTATGVSRTNGWVIGNLARNFNCSTGSCPIIFDVGTANGYSGVDEVLSISQAGSYSQTMKAVQAKHPNIVGTNALQRYWVLTSASGPASAFGTATFHYLAADVVGAESLYKMFSYNGSFTQFTPNVLNTASHFATLNNFVSGGDWTLAEPGSVNPPDLNQYPNTSVALSSNTTVLPAPSPSPSNPRNTTSLSVSTSTDFKGELEADPATGIVRVTNAHPAGTYPVTLTASNQGTSPFSRTFTLTVTTPATCTPVSFAPASSYSVGLSPVAIAVGDFNRDGKQDLVTANSAQVVPPNKFSVLLGDGAGGFGSASGFDDSGSGPQAIAVADFNADGKQDIAVANQSSNNVSILLGDGAGNFLSPTIANVGSTPMSIVTADFNGDGKPDLATANFSSSVSILIGDGNGNFAVNTISVGSLNISLAAGDIDRDGINDLVVANNSNSNATVLHGNGAGNFSSAGTFNLGGRPQRIALGDFNGDLNPDLVSANNFSSNGVSVLLNNGSGGFNAFTNYTTGSNTIGVAVGDFNGDGKQDIAANNLSSNDVSILLGVGDGTFGAATQYSTPGGPYSVVVGDFNGDNLQDLAISSQGSDKATVLLRQCQPSLSIDDVPHNEGNSGTTDYTFTVTLSAASAQTTTVHYQTVDGTATIADSDYQSASGDLIFNPGEVAKQVTVLVNGDSKFEPGEAFTVHLSSAAAASISDADGTGTITNDDSRPGISIDDVTHNEGNSGAASFTFTVSLSNPSAETVFTGFATISGTATVLDNDYQPTSGTLTFNPGETSKTVNVNVNGDTRVESDETFTVHLSNVNNATFADADGLGTITNDDTDVSVAITSPVSASVAEDGAPNLVYRFTRAGVTSGSLTVNFSVGGTTTFGGANGDYTQSGAATFSASSGTVTFGAGNSTADVTIDPAADTRPEANETVILTVTSGTGYNVASPSAAAGTITDDDACPASFIVNGNGDSS